MPLTVSALRNGNSRLRLRTPTVRFLLHIQEAGCPGHISHGFPQFL